MYRHRFAGLVKDLKILIYSSYSKMSTSYHPSVVTYTEEICPDGAPVRYAGFFSAIFKDSFPLASITVLDTKSKPEALKEHLSKAEVLVTTPADLVTMMEYISNVKWVHLTFAGYDPVTKYLRQTPGVPDFRVTRMGGTFGDCMAEYVVGYIIAHERKFEAMKDAQKSRRWDPAQFRIFRMLSELTIAIVGAGDIGCQVAKQCKSLGMRTIGVVTREREVHERSEFIDDYRLTADVLGVYADCDVLCNILPSGPNTIEFYKEESFRHCTKKPLFINIGRGDAVKSETIIKALRNDWISAAVLDVVDPEPFPEEMELWNTPGVTITPHNSGIVSEKHLVDIFIQNYEKFVRDEKMSYELDLANLSK